nr:hypothetical protein [Tanacetum cinerariifolium]
MVQNVGNQNGLIGVQGNGNQNQIGNGNLVAARTEGNAAGQNGNQIRCYNCKEVGIQLQAEEYDLMAAAADLDGIEKVNANCILMANLQQASTSGTQTDSAPVYDTDGSAEKVWSLVDLPYGKKAIRTKWVYRNKKDERGIVVRNKARMVAQGHKQDEGIDYNELFAPMARIEAIKIFLAFTSFMGFIVYQMDIKSAFLYGTIKEEVTVGEEGIFISQDKYVAEILKKFDFSSVKTASTPIETQKPLVKDEEAAKVDVHLYRSMIGSLMYLTASRPDIMFTVCACSRFQVTPKLSHLHAVKRIFRYLKGQPKLGLWYPRDSPFDLEAYSNSDYAGANIDRKSKTGVASVEGSVREGTSTDDLPTQDDQVRDYQWTQRRRFELQRGFRRLRGQRIGAGTNALLVLQDTRWTNTTRIISTKEVDLAQGTQLVYMVPNMMISINDFHDHIRVSIQTHGYEAWQGGESNLLVTMSMMGRLTNTSYVGFNYNIENVVEHLSTSGISAIPGERKTMEELEKQSWRLRPVENKAAKVPTRVAVQQRMNRTTSLRFERYTSQVPSRASVDQRDQELMGDEEEILIAAIALMENEAPHRDNEGCICEECLHNIRHITYDVCFCKECLTEAEDLKYEPIKAQKRSNKPKNKKKQKWSTLGEPSGKWDYYVRYDNIQETTPIEEIAATGWGDEFKDQHQTPNQNPTTRFIVQEQEILESSESEWENPFATKRGENQEHYYFHLNEEDEELPYPKFKKEVERILASEVAYPADEASSSGIYNPPKDSMMGPPVYPPSTGIYQQNDGSQFQPKNQKGYKGDYGSYYNQQWSLPPAYAGT